MAIYLNKSTPTHPISEMCKTIRHERQITQCALAKLIGTTQNEVSYMERGLLPEPDTIVAISDLYKQTQYYHKQTLINRS